VFSVRQALTFPTLYNYMNLTYWEYRQGWSIWMSGCCPVVSVIRPTRSRFSVIGLCPGANSELVSKLHVALNVLLMQPHNISLIRRTSGKCLGNFKAVNFLSSLQYMSYFSLHPFLLLFLFYSSSSSSFSSSSLCRFLFLLVFLLSLFCRFSLYFRTSVLKH
jgi:hypothetical protein